MKNFLSFTTINKIHNDWTVIKNHCRTTVNKEFTDNVPSSEFKRKLLISEHSPIRLLEFDWSWKEIKYWVSTEWARHKFEKFISTQRTDRTGEDRNKKPQNALVNFDGYANAQNCIDAWRKRLCYQATNEARELAEDFKYKVHEIEPEFADTLVPNCIYRCGCPEFKSCGFWDKFVKNHADINMFDINQRYKAANNDFYELIKNKERNTSDKNGTT